jgi:hypothetical protein
MTVKIIVEICEWRILTRRDDYPAHGRLLAELLNDSARRAVFEMLGLSCALARRYRVCR